MPILKRNGKTFSGTPTKVDTAKSYTTFDSADDKNPTTWSDVELLTSKEEQRSLFSKISTMFKNIRYLYKMLGTTDISNIGDGTVTGGIDAIGNKLGNTDISAIGDGTVTGGLNALNSNLYNAKNPVMLYDISTNSYNANDFLGGNIDMSAYSGFLIYYSDRTGGYQKSSYFTGKMSGMYQALDFTNGNDKHYFAGVQVRGNGLFVEIVGANKPFIWRLYGIPA